MKTRKKERKKERLVKKNLFRDKNKESRSRIKRVNKKKEEKY